MFFEHVSLVQDKHAPDVLSALTILDIRAAAPVSGVVTAVAKMVEDIVFPPYLFTFSAQIDRTGQASVGDDLPDEAVIFFQPYDYFGSLVPFQAELTAAAWAFALLTKRRVMGRPSLETVFAGSHSVESFSCPDFDIHPSLQQDFPYDGIACGNDLVLPTFDGALRSTSIPEVLKNILGNDRERYCRVSIVVARDRSMRLETAPGVSSNLFLMHRDALVASAVRQKKLT